MDDIEVLEEIILNFKEGIKYMHDAVTSNYKELSSLRNKKFEIEKLLKKLQRKQ